VAAGDAIIHDRQRQVKSSLVNTQAGRVVLSQPVPPGTRAVAALQWRPKL